MNQFKYHPLLCGVALLLSACGGGGSSSSSTATSPTSSNPAYQLSSVNDVSNQSTLSLTNLISAVNAQSPATTGSGCDGSSSQPVSFAMWVGDYNGLSPALSTYSNDIDRIQQMVDRTQVFYSASKFSDLVNNLSTISGDNVAVVPKGTSEVWYEFFCSTGTLSAGKVSL